MIRKCSLTRAIRLVVATSSEKVKFIFYKCVNAKYSIFSVKDRYQLNIVFVSKTSMHRQLFL
jgi:hypothetical protein